VRRISHRATASSGPPISAQRGDVDGAMPRSFCLRASGLGRPVELLERRRSCREWFVRAAERPSIRQLFGRSDPVSVGQATVGSAVFVVASRSYRAPPRRKGHAERGAWGHHDGWLTSPLKRTHSLPRGALIEWCQSVANSAAWAATDRRASRVLPSLSDLGVWIARSSLGDRLPANATGRSPLAVGIGLTARSTVHTARPQARADAGGGAKPRPRP